MPSFVPNKPSLNHFMRETAKKRLKYLKKELNKYFQAYPYSFWIYKMQHNNMYHIVFRAKQTKFTTLCEKVPNRLKNLKTATYHSISTIWILFSILMNSTQKYIPKSVMQSFVPNKPSLNHIMRECAKLLKKS